MSHLRRVDDHVRKLFESVSTAARPDDTKQNAADLGQALSDIPDKDIDYLCSTLFNSEYGLIPFLKKAGGNKELNVSTAVKDILLLLVKFVERRRKYPVLQVYAENLKKESDFISKNGSAASRGAAIELLIALIDKKNKFDTSEFDVISMYKKYSEEYTLPKTKLPIGIKSKIIELLGKIARYHPKATGPMDYKKLKRWCFDNLEHQMKLDMKDAESPTVSGSLECLNCIMHCENDHTVQPQSEESDRLFAIILAVMEKYRETSRYAPPISAMVLFKDHTDFFSNMFVEHWKDLFECLHYWATHHNNNTYKYGLQAYEEYLRQISTILYQNIRGRQEQVIFSSLMRVFNQELKTADNLENFYKVSVSIRAVGYFAKVCYKLLKEEEVATLRNSLVKISDWFYADTNTNQRDYMRHLPAFIKAYTLFAAELDPIPVELMETLHRMCNTYIMGYNNISGYHRRNGVYNIYSLFCVLYQKGEGVFRNFLNEFFEKALISTCTEVKSPDNDEERPAYNELLYFWKAILNKPYDSTFHVNREEEAQQNGNTQGEDENEEDLIILYRDALIVGPANLSDTLYDAFLLAVLKLTKTFNLKLKNVAEEIDASVDDDEGKLNTVSNSLQPLNQKDFILFQNLVEFWCLVLKELDNKRLSDWVYIVGTAIIDQSVLNPLVSGFYRMMSVIMVVCEKKQFFLGCKAYCSQTKSELQTGKLEVPNEYATFLVFREYFKEVWHRLQQFTDELLAACLRLILSYPIAFFDLTELITPLEKALKLGITYHPLATIAMKSLDKLLDPNLGYDINSEFLSRILPCINEYLLVGVVNDANEGPLINKKKYKAPTAAQRRYQSVHIKMTSDQLGVAKSDYSALPELQLRMMQFLGRLGGKNKQLLSQSNASVQTNELLAWDPVKRLRLRIPFRNSKVDVYLDEFLPRICELAESSPDRQVKVAACELLHGVTLFMIGNDAFQARDSKAASESDYHKFYLHVFPVMLRLAIDPDQVAREMYRTLFSQTIHWLTNNAHYENPETIALLQTCLDAACNPDAGLRDYGAECIQEFVKWSIKQTSRSTDGATNISSLLKRLYNLMSNPSATKRLGASLVFNKIYRLFREEPVLVNKFTLEILGQLFLSLKMAEADHPSIGTRDRIIEAISHIKRIIREKVDVFRHNNEQRASFIGAEEVNDLASVVEWTFKESGKIQRTYAKVCMNFFTEFVVKLEGVKSAKDWLRKMATANPNYYFDIFETANLDTPSFMEDEEKIMAVYANWIKRLNSALDGYIWLIERKVLDPIEFLKNLNSKFAYAVSYFIKYTPYDVLEEKLNQSIIEKTKILSNYSHISVRLIYFFDLVFKNPESGQQCYNYMINESQSILHHNNFTNLIARTLLLPKRTSEIIQSDEGNAITNSGVNRIYSIAKDYIMSMKEKPSSEFMDALAVSVSRIIQEENVNILLTSESNSERSSLIKIIQTINAIKLLQSLGALEPICQKAHKLNDSHPESADKYCLLLFNQYLRLCQSTQDPLLIQLLGSSMVVAFSQSGFPEKHASDLLGFSGSLEKLANSVKLDVYQKYREYIYESMAYNFNVFSPILVSHIEHPVARNYISMFLGYLKQNRLSQRKLVFKFSDYLVNDPSLLEVFTKHSKTDDQLLDLIASLKLLFGADPGIMSRSKGKPIFDILWKAFMSLLDKKHPFVVKNTALDLLPIYITLDEPHTEMIVKKLNESVVQKFPPETESLERGTTLYNEYISYLDTLLRTMATFKSVKIFNLLIGVFVQEEHHIHEEAIKKNVEAFTNGLGLRNFMEVAEYCFREFKNEHNNMLQRHNLTGLIISLLTGVDDNAVVEFYKKNIEHIMCVIQRELASSPMKQVEDWNEKADCLRFIQALFNRLPMSTFKNIQDDLPQVWIKSNMNSSGKKIEACIVVAYTAIRKTPILPKGLANDNGRRDAQFLYNRSLFNAVAAIALCSGESEGQFKILFLSDSTYNTFIWDYIVDPAQEIQLKLELDKPLVKTRLNELREASGYSTERNEQNIAYMASIALTGSSFTQSSLSDMVLEENNGDSNQSQSKLPNVPAQVADTEMLDASNESEDEVEGASDFEIDALNESLFMKSLTEIIKKLHTKVCPPANSSDMPIWVRGLLNAFKSYDKENINIQLHIAKLIVNYPHAFEKYASSWILPLAELATKGAQYGEPINYLVQDICIVLIYWGKNYEIPLPNSNETRRILFEFLEFLIRNAYHEQQRIMRSNIQIIKGVFENWGKYIPVPTKAIHEQLVHKGDKSSQNIVGLQIVSIIFLNGANPYDANEFTELSGLSELKFYKDMVSNIYYRDRKKKDISADAAELMGMSIHYMKEKQNVNLASLQESYKKELFTLCRSTKHSSLHFLKCVNRLYLRDVELAREVLFIIIQNLNQYAVAEKLLAMNCIGACWKDEETVYYSLQQAGLERMISNRDENMQISTLTVLNKIFKILEEDEIKWIVKRISRAFSDSSNAQCRTLYYAFLKKAIEADHIKDTKFKTEIKAHLFKGLIDKDKSISQDMFSFVEHLFKVNEDINLTLRKVAREMYLPETEDIYLLYATCMILNNTKQSYDFDKPIFDKHLPNARFDADYQHINTSWHNTSSMMPLFRATQAQSLNTEDLELELKRTQSLLDFSTTQGTSRSLLATFNPEAEDTNQDQTLDDMSFLEETKPDRKKLEKKKNPYYRKRFTETPRGATNQFHSDRNEKLEKKIRNLKNTYKEISEKRVTLSRSYRVGELPDVQINFKDLLLPLEVLASADYNISRLLYSNLVVGIIKANVRDTTGYETEIVKDLEKNITDSVMNFTPTIGSFLRIFFELNVTDLPDNFIRNASDRSSNHHIGIALLEKQLEIGAEPPNAGKRKRAESYSDDVIISPEEKQKRKSRWIDLGLLYKNIDEPEIFQNVYLTNVATEEVPKQAINAEIKGDFITAFNSFQEALELLPDNVDERSLWNEEMLYCYTQLSQWGDIARVVNDATDNAPLEHIWEPNTKDLYLPYFVRSHSKFDMREYEGNQIATFFEQANTDDAHKEYLLKNYACDWTAVTIYNRNYDLGLRLIKSSYDSLLSAWTTLHPLAHTSRLAKLGQLERTVELEDFLKLIKKVKQNTTTSDKIEDFFKSLSLRYPDEIADSIDVWHDIIDSRFSFINDLNGQNSEIVRRELPSIDRYLVKYLIAMSEAAIKQDNVSALQMVARKFEDISASYEAQLCNLQWFQSSTITAEIDHPNKHRLMMATLGRTLAFDSLEHSNTSDVFKSKLVLAQSFDIVKQQLIIDPNLFNKMMEKDKLIKVFKNDPGVVSNADTLMEYLESTGFDRLIKAGKSIDEENSLYIEYLWKTGNYCDRSLRTFQDATSTLQAEIDPVQYSKLVIKYYFEAIGRGHLEAWENFPRLLELVELYPDCGPFFKECSLELGESWKYIRWIPQLLSFTETPIAAYIFPALLRLAEDYPKALYYPFQMSFEYYDLKKDTMPEESQQVVERIMAMIKSETAEKFIFELQRLTDPDLMVKDFVDFVKVMLCNKDVPGSFVEFVYGRFRDLFLNYNKEGMGSFHKKFSRLHTTQLSQILGKEGANLYKFTDTNMKKFAKFQNDHIRGTYVTHPPPKGYDNLKNYSPWLLAFKSSNSDEELEIPGQYDGLSRPYPEFHAKVTSVDPNLLCLSSIRRPKRIKIYGSDEKEYLFLVKGGEDLRLDQRIEQIFSVMNNMIKKNAFCSKQNIQIPTYKVVPMSSNLGMIEWVSNTKTLRSCVMDQQSVSNRLIPGRMENKYRDWIARHRSNNPHGAFHKAMEDTRLNIESAFTSVTEMMPRTVLRDFMLSLSSSPEAFLFLRKDFAHSVACVSIFGYILGIGDRHLENFLIDMKSGRFIPIDFGHAFGSATDALPIPELIPFRLTRQIVGVMEPLGVSGVLENAMANILQAIQNEKGFLINIMNVFVKDPLLDWTKAAANEAKNQKNEGHSKPNTSDSAAEGKATWYHERKLNIVKRKLNGDNPADIISAELTNGHDGKSFYQHAIKLAKGDPNHNIRARTGYTCKDAREQVQCLVDLATDTNILGVAYAGWMSYI